MPRRRAVARVTLALLTSAVAIACGSPDVSPSAPLTSSALSRSGAVTFWEVGSSVYWNQAARGLLELLPPPARNPLVQARLMAYLSIAQHNAVVAAEQSKQGSHHPSPSAAVSGASVMVLKAFLPTLQLHVDALLQDQLAEPGWPGDAHRDIEEGLTIGRSVGTDVVAYAATDGTNQTPAPPNPGGPGTWIGVNPVTALYGARLLTLESANQFLPAPPPPFGSPAFEAALDEVRLIVQQRTPAQVASALYWAPRNNAALNETVAELIVHHRRTERDAARIFALANIAGFDVLNACFTAKLTYWYVRPTQVDPTIPFIPGVVLPNHPAYPSAHSCGTAAFATVLAAEFPSERPRLEAMVAEASLSRIVAAFHYRFDVDAGEQLGRDVANWALAHAVPKRGPIPLD
jgi:membrane-associated phospholipid phosphatase